MSDKPDLSQSKPISTPLSSLRIPNHDTSPEVLVGRGGENKGGISLSLTPDDGAKVADAGRKSPYDNVV